MVVDRGMEVTALTNGDGARAGKERGEQVMRPEMGGGKERQYVKELTVEVEVQSTE